MGGIYFGYKTTIFHGLTLAQSDAISACRMFPISAVPLRVNTQRDVMLLGLIEKEFRLRLFQLL